MSQVSIAEARDHLPRLVQEAEKGNPVRITRRGIPVAVILSDFEYERLMRPRPALQDFLQDWRRQMLSRNIPFASEDGRYDDFNDLRDDGERAPLDLAQFSSGLNVENRFSDPSP